MATSPIGGTGNTSPIQYLPEASTSNAPQSSSTGNSGSTESAASGALSGLRKKRSLSPDAESSEAKRRRGSVEGDTQGAG